MTDVADWWTTRITNMEPGKIELRGHSIESLIEQNDFVATLWLMTQGQNPTQAQRTLLSAALVAAVDHGPQAPSIAAARMASTCGIGLNNAMATGINMLGDVHGGAGQQALTLYQQILAFDAPLEDAVSQAIQNYPTKYIPGFGHRFHKPEDPRAKPLMDLVRAYSEEAEIDGRYVGVAEAIQQQLSANRPVGIAMNIDGATAVIYGALGVSPELARGYFCLSRSVGILAHAWEQTQQGGRNKGPTPPGYRWTYSEEK
ncbi:MAG: citryl-CoA lyase [Pseudomonadales bacterium]|jgi:citrate synthase